MKNNQQIHIDQLFAKAAAQPALMEITEVNKMLAHYQINPGIRTLSPSKHSWKKWLYLLVGVVLSVVLVILLLQEPFTKNEKAGETAPQSTGQSAAPLNTDTEESNSTTPVVADTLNPAPADEEHLEPMPAQEEEIKEDFKPEEPQARPTPDFSYPAPLPQPEEPLVDPVVDPVEVMPSEANAIPTGFTHTYDTLKVYEFRCGHYQSDSLYILSMEPNYAQHIYLEAGKGDIEVRTWDKEEIRIEALLTICAENKDDADLMLTKYKLDTYTACGNQKVKLYANYSKCKYKDKSESYMYKFCDKDKVEIKKLAKRYRVYAPANQMLKLKTSKGDVYLNQRMADVNVQLTKGKLYASDIPARMQLRLSYAEAQLDKVDRISLYTSQSDIRIKGTDMLKVDRSYRSKIHIDSIRKVEIYTSSNDRLNIQHVSSFSAQKLYRTNLDIHYLVEELNIASAVKKSLVIHQINPHFNCIEIDGHGYTCRIHAGTKVAFDLKAALHSSVLDYPENYLTGLEKEKKGEVLTLSGHTQSPLPESNPATIRFKGTQMNYFLF